MSNESVSSGQLQEKAKRFRVLCRELGIHTSDKNSVCQRLEAVEQFCAAKKPSDHVETDVLSKNGEFLWLAECLESFKDRIKGSIHIKKLLSEKTYANELAELMTALIVEQAGYRTTFDEPDVVARVGDSEVSFACKKSESVQGLVALVKGARRQIVRWKRPGIIVVDVGDIVKKASETSFATAEEAKDSLLAAVEVLWVEFQAKLLEQFFKAPVVNSILLMASRPCLIRKSIDHERRTVVCVAFHPIVFSFRSRKKDRAACVVTLEDAILARK